jgi:hypothetical protein
MCRVDEIQPRSATSPERSADGYAADLLMPGYLFRPMTLGLPRTSPLNQEILNLARLIEVLR